MTEMTYFNDYELFAKPHNTCKPSIAITLKERVIFKIPVTRAHVRGHRRVMENTSFPIPVTWAHVRGHKPVMECFHWMVTETPWWA
ncbi:hypothetical protein ACOMHN_020524 [Nucella lapillus]